MMRWITLTLLLTACTNEVATERFEVRVENIALEALEGPGGEYMAGFSPGWVRASADDPIFVVGEPASMALQVLAEEGDPTLFAGEPGVSIPAEFAEVSYDTSPLLPGESFTTAFDASPGDVLHLVTMLGVSNDTFVGLQVPLYEDGEPIVGDFTEFAQLYDAGTEVNEAFGYGENQPSMGSGGEDEELAVRPFTPDAAGNAPPPVNQMLRITISRILAESL